MIHIKKESGLDLHFLSPVLDAHCDPLTALDKQDRRLGQMCDRGHLDLPRLSLGGVNIQFMAAFISDQYRENPLSRAMEVFDTFYREMEDNFELVEPVYTFADINRIISLKKVAALLTVEGGRALCGRMEVLRMFYRLGVRSVTLTWNGRNELGDGVLESGSGGGLTRFGIEVVKEMNSLGMLIDVSHLSESGFWDVVGVTEKPFVASHSNCRAICDHPRNLKDDQIKALAEAGGVMGLCFYPVFLSSGEATLDTFLDHAEHLAQLAGVGCMGIGSDFDGIDSTIPEINDVTRLPLVTEGLLKRGFSDQDVQKILGGNFLRVLEKVL